MERVTERLTLDDIFGVLADVQRRRLLVALAESNPQGELPESGTDAAGDGGPDAVDRLVQMRHVHLPKLADHGLINWDEETHEVTKGPEFGEIEPLLELLRNHEDELPDGWL